MSMTTTNTTVPVVDHYGFRPTLWVCVTILVSFALSTAIHGYQAFLYKNKIWLATAFTCGATESLGWGGRLWSHFNLPNKTPYLIQIVTTICAPTFLVAALFMTLGEIIRRLGPCYSRIQPRMYSIIFISIDFVSLTIQGIGGGLAATAKGVPTTGGHIMLVGICLQLIGLTAYSALAIEFGARYYYDRPMPRPESEMLRGSHKFTKSMSRLVQVMLFATIVLFIRAVYRVIELNAGWNGSIIRTERWFVIFDALMVLLAMWTLNIFHFERLLGYDDSYSVMNAPYEGVRLRDNTSDPDLTERFDGNNMTMDPRNTPLSTFVGVKPEDTSTRYSDPYYSNPSRV